MGKADHADDAQDAPEREPGGQLAEGHTPPVAQAELPQRERADDQRGRLRAGVAARADDQRDEEREHDGSRDLALEVAHRRGRQHLAEKQRREPARALPDHAGEGDLRVRLLERLETAEALGLVRVVPDHGVDRDFPSSHGEVLIPLVAEICTEIDVAGRRIVVNPPDGLLELNAPGGQS